MPEKKYPPRFDFKAMETKVPVEFTLLKASISRETVDAQGEKFWWHLYPVTYAGNEMSLFTPNDRVHAGLEYLKVRPGDKFTITKDSDVNTRTGNSFIFYKISCKGDTIDTKDSLPSPEAKTEKPEDDLTDIPYIKEPKGQELDYVEEFACYYGPIMDKKLKWLEKRINVQKLTDAEYTAIITRLDESTSRLVSTILIQNGGRR